MSIHQHATLEDTVYFWFAANDTSGSGGDGASPLADVRLAGAAASAAPVLSPTPALLSHASFPAGCYEVAVAATAGNGFAATNTYAVFCTLAVDSQNPTGFVGSFTLDPIIANVKEVSDDSTAADNLELDYDGTGYAKANSTIGTCTTNTDLVTAVAVRTEIDSNSTQLALIVADTNELQVDWTDGGRLDLILDAILLDTGTTLETHLTDIQGGTFSSGTDSLEAIRDRGDAAWTTGAGTGLTALASGTAQSGTASTIVLASGEAFADDILNGNTVKITAGTGAGQARLIISNTLADDTCNVAPNWTTNPSSDSVYEIVEGSANIEAISLDNTAANNLESACDNYSATRGLAGTAVPAVVADGAGGLPISDAGGLDLDNRMAAAASITRMNLLYGTDASYAATYSGPRGPGIYLNDAAGNTNTVNGTDGTFTTPVSTIAAAKTLADSMSIDRIYLVNNTSITLAATMVDYEFVGIGEVTANAVNLGSQDVSNSAFYSLCIQGTQGGSGRILAVGCALADPGAGATTLHVFACFCGIVDEIEVDTSNDNVFDQCFSLVAGTAAPIIIATGASGTIAVRHFSGGVEFKSLSASHNVSAETDGQVIFNADCNVNATVVLRGNMEITDNTAGMNSLTQTSALNMSKWNVTPSGNIGIDWANVENPTTAVDLSATDIQLCDTITTYTSNTPQTGDNFARIGAAGAGLTDLGGMSSGMKAEVNVEVDGALDTVIPELSVGVPTATPTVRTGIMLLYMPLRNKLVVQTSGTDAIEIHNDAGTKIASKAITDDGSDYTEAEMVSG